MLRRTELLARLLVSINYGAERSAMPLALPACRGISRDTVRRYEGALTLITTTIVDLMSTSTSLPYLGRMNTNPRSLMMQGIMEGAAWVQLSLYSVSLIDSTMLAFLSYFF